MNETGKSIVKELERVVVSTNTVLKDVVKDMDVLLLLRNVHPSVRVDYAYLCRDNGLLHTSEIDEFIKPKDFIWRKSKLS